MSVVQGQIITYGEIKALVLNKIKSIIKNPSTGYVGVPSEMQANFSQTLVSPAPQNKSTGVITIKNETVVPIVSTSTKIDEQFEAYLVSKGVSAKADTVMTATSLLNFYNVAAAFVTTKIVLVTTYLSETTVPMYVEDNTTFPDVPVKVS